MKEIEIHFKDLKDFERRFASIWSDQKEGEVYAFSFGDDETEEAFVAFCKRFNDNDLPILW